MGDERNSRRRSEIWFNDLAEPGETGVYLERFGNYGITRKELQSGRPVIGVAQSGGDLTPCNRVHVGLATRVKDGIRDAGGIPFEFPIHPIQESCRRPTAALDRNLAYLGLVEILCGYPFDGVVLMTGCDKTTPACLMAAATVNLPAIVLSGGPMINSYINGKLAGSGNRPLGPLTGRTEPRRSSAQPTTSRDPRLDDTIGDNERDRCNDPLTRAVCQPPTPSHPADLNGSHPADLNGSPAPLRPVQRRWRHSLPSSPSSSSAALRASSIPSGIGATCPAQPSPCCVARRVAARLRARRSSRVGSSVMPSFYLEGCCALSVPYLPAYQPPN